MVAGVRCIVAGAAEPSNVRLIEHVVARGEQVFNSIPINLTGVGGFNGAAISGPLPERLVQASNVLKITGSNSTPVGFKPIGSLMPMKKLLS